MTQKEIKGILQVKVWQYSIEKGVAVEWTCGLGHGSASYYPDLSLKPGTNWYLNIARWSSLFIMV